MALTILAAALLSCVAIDGDTLRCGAPGQAERPERVRLIGIDAPEMPGHCASWRKCAPGDPQASHAALARLVRGTPIRLERHGQDRYGRTLAFAWSGKINLSCAQIRAGHAIYVARWDMGGRIGKCARKISSLGQLGRIHTSGARHA